GPVRYAITPEALEALCRYDWPGNVRELANVIERAQILAEDHVLTVDDLPEGLLTWGPAADGGEGEGSATSLHQAQRRHVVAFLREAGGNKVHAARALGVSRRARDRLLDKYRLRGHGEAGVE